MSYDEIELAKIGHPQKLDPSLYERMDHTECAAISRRFVFNGRKEKMTPKVRLNDEQWKKLLSLLAEGKAKTHVEPSPNSNRLRSHGLVTQDSQSHEYLTEQGIRRLSQGR